MSTARFEYGAEGPIGTVRTFEEIVEPYSNNSSFRPGQKVDFDIPTGRKNTFLDPDKTFLEFTLTNTCTNTGFNSVAQLDGSAHSVVRRIKLSDQAGGKVLEDIDQVAALSHLLLYATADPDTCAGFRSGPEGFFPFRASYDQTTGAQQWSNPALAQGTYMGNYFDLTGAVTTPTSTANASTSNSFPAYVTGNSQTFALPLLSTVGLLGNKYIPVYKLIRPMRMELTLNDASAVFVRVSPSIPSATLAVVDKNNQGYTVATSLLPFANSTSFSGMDLPGYTVSNIRLHVGYVQVDDDSIKMIEETTGGKFAWTSRSYRFFRNTTYFPSPTNMFNIPARLSSARCVLSVWREKSALAATIPRYTSAFPKAYTTSFQYQLGTKQVPQRPITSVSTAIRYFMDAVDSYVHRIDIGKPNSLNLVTSNQDESVYAVNVANNGGTYCMAVDLGGPCGNDLNTFMGGAQTLGEDLMLTTTYSVQPTQAAVGYYLDSYVLHDVLFEIDSMGNFSATV